MAKPERIVERKVGKSPLLPLGAGEVKYYDFSQNNSGGTFANDENVAENVIIAARNKDEANSRAESVGIYFNGCDDERDCECCGDRWYAQYNESKDLQPLIYGDLPPEKYLIEHGYSMRTQVIVHHADGTRETFTRVDAKK